MQETKYKLSYPIAKQGKELKEIVILRPKIKDIKGINFENMQTDDLVKLFKNLIQPSLSEAEIEAIDLKDFKEIQEIITAFLQK